MERARGHRGPLTLEAIYGDWRLYNDLVIDAIRAMPPEELALTLPAGDASLSAAWPIWAIAGHTAGTRVFWLCEVAGLPGREATPFREPGRVGWEDDLEHPRTSHELVAAWTTTWKVVELALASWTPETLDDDVAPGSASASRHLTRRSLVLRMITHEAFHAGQIATIQALQGRPSIDLWPPGYHTVEAAAARAVR